MIMTQRTARLLFLGNDGALGTYLGELLEPAGFQLELARQDPNSLSRVVLSQPNALILELLPDKNLTLTLCRNLRRTLDIPMVVCSSSASEPDIVRALEAGADDFLLMPLQPVEMTARLRAVLRLGDVVARPTNDRDRLTAGDIEIRLDEHRAYKNRVLLDLSPIEFRLLLCLVKEAGRVVTHTKLLAQVWGSEYVDSRHYLRLYVGYLRAKVEDDRRDPKVILSEWGVGYRFQQSAVTEPLSA